MTKDDIIRMAREAGLAKTRVYKYKTVSKLENTDALERFAALIAAHEREWVGLTDEEIGDFASGYRSGRIGSFVELTESIEAKLKERNHVS